MAATTTTSILGGVSPDPDKAYEFPIWHYADSCKAEFWIKNIGQEPIYKFSDMSVFIDFDDGSDIVLLKYFKGNYVDLSPGEWTYVIPNKLDDLGVILKKIRGEEIILPTLHRKVLVYF